METQRLKSIQVPDRTLDLLESFAYVKMGFRPGAYRLESLKDLPPQFRRHVGSGPNQQYAWFAWRIEDHTYLVTGAMSLERSRERGRPVLEVRSYDADGLLDEFAAWMRTAGGKWERCSD